MSNMNPNELVTVVQKMKLKSFLNLLYWNILFLILTCNRVTPSLISLSDLKGLVEFVLEVHEKYQDLHNTYGVDTQPRKITLEDVSKSARKVSRKVVEFAKEREIWLQIDRVEGFLQRLPSNELINKKKRDLFIALTAINGRFIDFMTYIDNDGELTNSTIENFMKAVISENDNDLMHLLMTIRQIFVPDVTEEVSKSLLSLIKEQKKIIELQICGSDISPQETLFQLSAHMVTSQIRGFVMLSFACTFLSIYQKRSYRSPWEKSQRDFAKESEELMAAVRAAMREMPRTIRRCDPQTFIRDTNYLEFYGFIQGFIANEEQLNPDRSCDATCSTMVNPRVDDCQKDLFYSCLPSNCSGTVHNCVHGGPGVWRACIDVVPPRRYSYFVDGHGNMNGKETKCSNEKTFQWYYYQAIYRCDYCMCHCVDDATDSLSLRAISLRPQTSKIHKNMVITGIKFVLKDQMIHIQIKQGRLQPGGRIQDNTESWNELGEFRFTPKNAKKNGHESFDFVRGSHHDPTRRQYCYPAEPKYDKLEYGKDFTVLKFDQKRIHLDDLLAPKDHVVTGIRFQHPRTPERTESEPIEIAIRVTLFDYASGRLLTGSEEQWISARDMGNLSEDYHKPRAEVNLNDKLGNPTQSPSNLPDSIPNSYIEFRASGFREDAAQSTIPFLDSQPVSGMPSFPLAGVGLFHKGSQGHGGFLAFKIFTIDLPNYMD